MSVQRVINEINQMDYERNKRIEPQNVNRNELLSCIELVSKLNYARENPQNYYYEKISSINSLFGTFASKKVYSTTCSQFDDFVRTSNQTNIKFKTTRVYVDCIKTKVFDGNKILYELH